MNAISGELARAKRESVVRPVVAVPDAVTSALVPEFAPSQGLKPVEERFDLVVDAVPATQFFGIWCAVRVITWSLRLAWIRSSAWS